jgi:hypothetical protein
MTQDTFAKHSRSLTAPPEEAAPIAPDNTADLAVATRALYVGTGGDVRLRMLGGGEVTLTNLASGSLIPVRAIRVFATGTNANGLIGFW